MKLPALPKATSQYGAEMGRSDTPYEDNEAGLVFHLVRLALQDGDYDKGGAYWGFVSGTQMYRAAATLADDTDDNAEIVAEMFFRSTSPDAAWKMVTAKYPNAVLSVDRPEYDPDEFFDAYVTAALWSSTDGDDTPLDNEHTAENIDAETTDKMRADCERFQAINTTLLSRYYEALPLTDWTPEAQAGHDLWLSRNGHGAGFFDRNVPKAIKDALQDSARAFGTYDLYVGDDGVVYGS